MTKLKAIINYFTKTELIIWTTSVIVITIAFFIFDRINYSTLLASYIGSTSLILNAKGNPIGMGLCVAFSIFYGIVSYSFAYYGEMITYLCMTAPMSVISLIAWIKNPYGNNKSQVAIAKLKKSDVVIMFIFATIVTIIFYFILKFFNTANLSFSTLSITTSFCAVYLTAKRSSYYAIAYSLNDVVLIIMWTLATLVDISYISVVICFIAFLVNDIYGFINWRRMAKIQAK